VARILPPPSPPFVELGIYSHSHEPDQLLLDVAQELVDSGAEVLSCHVHAGLAGIVPESVSERDREERKIGSLADVDQLGVDRLISVEVSRVFPYEKKSRHTIITRVVDPADRNASLVAVLATGTAFEGAAASRFGPEGRQVFSVFSRLVERIEPDYATLTVDWPIVSPSSLAANRSAVGDYRDFYLARSYVGSDSIERVRSGTDGTITEKGILVATSRCFGGSERHAIEAAAVFAAIVGSQA
jgi:hypothetical protein